jgi:hypothetical protein
MSLNGYTAGRDTSVTVILPDGTPLNLGTVLKFRSKRDSVDQKIVKINSKIDNIEFPQGWSGSWDLERTDHALDDYFNQFDANFYDGQDQRYVTIQQTVVEADGSISQWQFNKCTLKYDDAGEFAGDKTTSQKLSFMAEQRISLI